MTDVVTGSLQVDLKRRTTLPGDILAAAGIRPGSPLVARVEEPGRIVLESPALLLSRLQDDIAAALARPADRDDDAIDDLNDSELVGADGPVRDLVAELLADRVVDASLSSEQAVDDDERSATVEPDREGGDHGASAGEVSARRNGAA